jgi:uncharacterized membrane protein
VSGYLAAKLFELALIAIWLGFVFAATGHQSHARYLLAWDIVAGIYLGLAALVMRHRRGEHAEPVRKQDVVPWLRPLTGPRFDFACILAASLAGLTSAGAVLYYAGDSRAGRLQVIGALAILFAWCLLHAGYGRFYAGLYYEAGDPSGVGGSRPALEFPHDDHPTAVDFFYFSFTLGTSFAVSDVTVTTPSMRWHVMTHSVLCFFYNAVVLALAVGILTNR